MKLTKLKTSKNSLENIHMNEHHYFSIALYRELFFCYLEMKEYYKLKFLARRLIDSYKSILKDKFHPLIGIYHFYIAKVLNYEGVNLDDALANINEAYIIMNTFYSKTLEYGEIEELKTSIETELFGARRLK